MDIFGAYEIDEKLAKEGKWLVTRKGFDVKVAKIGNPNFISEVARLQKPHIHLLRSSADTSELLNKITIEAMSTSILMDWKATDKKGKSLPYTPELGQQLMTKSSDFQEDVSILATESDNFKPEVVAEK